MTVHAVLSEDATKALKEIVVKLKEHNPSLNKLQNALVSFAVTDLLDSLTEGKIKSLSERLLSRAEKRKLLESRMATLMQSLDEDTFQSMESGIKKVLNQFEKDKLSSSISQRQNEK